MNLFGSIREEALRNMKMTVLYREGGTWHRTEVDRIVTGLTTEASGHPKHPEYLVLFGHHTKETILEALGDGSAFTVTQVTGVESKELPFRPGFA